jgi:ribosomal protein S18 acetylase RimI-like enzyme
LYKDENFNLSNIEAIKIGIKLLEQILNYKAMDKIETRIAQKTDINDLVSLLAILFSQESDFHPNTSKQEKGLAMIIDNPIYGHILVATKTNKIIGMVNLLYSISTAEGSKAVILEDMVVNPEYRSLGIGSILLTEAIEFSKEQGCKRITLLTDHDNEKAIKFYSKQGFEKSTMIPLRLKI